MKCPEVPPATGKLIICAAKINAAVIPITGTCFSPSVLPVCFNDTAIAVPEIAVKATHVFVSKNPSGICIIVL